MIRPAGDAVAWVDDLLREATRRRVSDIHLSAANGTAEVRLRVDGLLEAPQIIGFELGRSAITRLMVLARLLTYRLDVPQEGRASVEIDGSAAELRISVIPVAGGLRCAVRLPTHDAALLSLQHLNLSRPVLDALEGFCRSETGMLIVTGPAGSGKTTTIHALLRHLVLTRPELSVVSLEDPVERLVPGIAQIEVSSFGELTYERALRSILRQDPQVLALGEVRDSATATLAIQAALTGHRLICTMHASSAATAIARLLEMGIEPFQINATLSGVLSQRLLRRREGQAYRGRVPIAAWTRLTDRLREAISARDANQLALASVEASATRLEAEASFLVSQGITDEAEVSRVLGTG